MARSAAIQAASGSPSLAKRGRARLVGGGQQFAHLGPLGLTDCPGGGFQIRDQAAQQTGQVGVTSGVGQVPRLAGFAAEGAECGRTAAVEHGAQGMGTGQHQAQATGVRWFLGHRGDDRCLGGQLGQRDIECGGEGFQHRHAVHLAHAALDLGDPGHRPVDHPGQLGLGQAPAAALGGDLAAQGLLVVRGVHPPVPLPVCRVSQSTSVLARYWPRSAR